MQLNQNNSIESILKWFNFTSQEEAQLRLLLQQKNKYVMDALSTFIKTKNTDLLEKEFKQILSSESIRTSQLSQSSQNANPYSYQRNNQTNVIIREEKIYGGQNSIPSFNKQYEVQTIKIDNIGSYNSIPSFNKQQDDVQTIKLDIIGGQNSIPSFNKQQDDIPTIKQDIIGGLSYIPQSKQPSRLPSANQSFSIDGKKRNKKVLNQKSIVDMNLEQNNEKSTILEVVQKFSEQNPIDYDFFDQQILSGQLIDPELRQQMMDISDQMNFQDFLELKFMLGLNEYNLNDLCMSLRDILVQSYPKDQNVERFNPGITLEQFYLVMGGKNLKQQKKLFLLIFFFYIDYNNNGLLDYDEILGGIITLGEGTLNEKIDIAFRLYDRDGNGTLDPLELRTYIRAWLRQTQGKRPKGSTAEQLKFFEQEIDFMSQALSEEIFKEIDLDGDNVVSCEEFKLWNQKLQMEKNGEEIPDQWFQKNLKVIKKQQMYRQVNNLTSAGQNVANDEKFIKNCQQTFSKCQEVSKQTLQLFEEELSQLKTELKLDKIPLKLVVKKFKSISGNVIMSKHQLFDFLKELYTELKIYDVQDKQLKQLCSSIAKVFDFDGNGTLDCYEIITAFTFLFAGDQPEKLRSLFDFFDEDCNEGLNFKELFNLLKATYQFMFSKFPALKQQLGKDHEVVAYATAKKCFNDSQKLLTMNADPLIGEEISYIHFQRWFEKAGMLV